MEWSLIAHRELLSFLIFLLASLHIAQGCSSHDLSSLIQLNASFYHYPAWTGDDCCVWSDITCDNKTARVVGISLSVAKPTDANKLEPLCHLSMLQSLDLSFESSGSYYLPSCDLQVTSLSLEYDLGDYGLPSSPAVLYGVCTLANLTRLVLADSSVSIFPTCSHCIPLQLMQHLSLQTSSVKFLSCLSVIMPNLITLSVAYDSVSPVSPPLLNSAFSVLASFKHLQSLQLQLEFGAPGSNPNVSIDVNIDLPSLCNLTSLTSLDVAPFTFLRFSNADCIGKFTSLQQLYFASNGVAGDILSPLSQLQNLQLLDLSSNSVTSTIPSSFAQLSSLQTLNLSSNSISGTIPASIFSQLQNLTSLDLSHNFLSGSIPASMSELQGLNTLDLSFNFLHGPIPQSLSNVSQLAYLDLSSNSLSGSIPPSLSALNLYLLHMHHNHLSGSIPEQMLGIPTLMYIDLSFNDLSGHLSSLIPNTSLLEYISLSYNQLKGPIPAAWINLQHLRVLYLSSNLFELQEAHASIFQLPLLHDLALSSLNLRSLQCSDLLFLNKSLNILDLSDNFFGKELLECFTHNADGFPGLSWLNLSVNPLQTALPQYAPGMQGIQLLSLSSCQLSGMHSGNFFRNISSLETLELSQNYLAGSIPSELASISSLTFLDLANNHFTSVSPFASGSNFSTLQFLLLSGNAFAGDLPTLLGRLQGLEDQPQAQHCCLAPASVTWYLLDISYNNLTGILPTCLEQCKQLQKLKLGSNHLHGEIPPQLGNLRSLTTLSLPNNNFTGEIPQEISRCSLLTVLDLSENQLHGALKTSLSQLSILRILSLRSNYLNGSIPYWVGNFSQDLQLIDLSSNSFTGVIPQPLRLEAFRNSDDSEGNGARRPLGPLYEESIQVIIKGYTVQYNYILTALVSLDLSNNKLTGGIPAQLGDLTATVFLNLSKNQFSGSIPTNLSQLSALESLDFSYNLLQGPIPSDFTKLTSLAVFNVSYNNLSGGLPQTPPFESKESYLGNDQLCDPIILHKKCAKDEAMPLAPAALTTPLRMQKHSSILLKIEEQVSLLGVALGWSVSFTGTISILYLWKHRYQLRVMLLPWREKILLCLPSRSRVPSG